MNGTSTWLAEQVRDVLGTADPDEVIGISREDVRRAAWQGLTGMDEEQADWESDEGDRST